MKLFETKMKTADRDLVVQPVEYQKQREQSQDVLFLPEAIQPTVHMTCTDMSCGP